MVESTSSGVLDMLRLEQMRAFRKLRSEIKDLSSHLSQDVLCALTAVQMSDTSIPWGQFRRASFVTQDPVFLYKMLKAVMRHSNKLHGDLNWPLVQMMSLLAMPLED